MDFIALDFETANSERSSPCEIGLVKVIDSRIVEKKSYLIQPEDNWFDGYNISIHGITPEMVEDEPEFDGVFPNIKDDLESFPIVAHYASFDMSVLRHTLSLYEIPFPDITYFCTYQLAKLHVKDLLSLRLDSLCERYKIPLDHHRALPDAEATALLALEMLRELEINELDEIESKLNLKLGKIFPGGYSPCASKLSGAYKVSDIDFDSSLSNPENQFYKKNVCFTGTLNSMPRREAMKIILEIGGNCSMGVNMETNYLVIGEQDYKQFGEGFKSSKMRKAEKYLKAGQDIELITERQFLEMMKN